MRPAARLALLALLLPSCAAFQSVAPATKQSHALEARKAEELKLICEELLGRMDRTKPGAGEAILMAAVIIRERWGDYVRLHEATARAIDAPPVVTEAQIGSIVDLVTKLAEKKGGP